MDDSGRVTEHQGGVPAPAVTQGKGAVCQRHLQQSLPWRLLAVCSQKKNGLLVP